MHTNNAMSSVKWFVKCISFTWHGVVEETRHNSRHEHGVRQKHENSVVQLLVTW